MFRSPNVVIFTTVNLHLIVEVFSTVMLASQKAEGRPKVWRDYLKKISAPIYERFVVHKLIRLLRHSVTANINAH